MKRALFFIIAFFSAISCEADPGRIYTAPDNNAQGGIDGSAPAELTHAIAINRDREHVYLAGLADGGHAFHFAHLPVGKYDLVLVTKNGAVYEGLALGDSTDSLSAVSAKHLQERISLADSFFNRYTIHRTGIDGDRILAFVERIRDKTILKQSGEKLDANLRRLEIIELQQATDDWQMVTTRHIYREDEPISENPPFFKHFYFSALGNIRVVDTVKDLGALSLPKNNP
ncbi:MAG TPA: hypothetical protein VG733_14685 [Chthoniobacteraceae bacterium]|nr:hypothetical protein [Chthoniobacteraceae bacterium]